MLVKQENFAKNVRQNKQVLKEIAGFLTEIIQRRGGTVSGWDFRFMVMVAQWLVEQGGYTMTPEGNNPGNVVAKGDLGTFTRSYNYEKDKDGNPVHRPDVKFAKYSTMKIGTETKFDILMRNWLGAYQALMNGDSSDAYVNGLYPGYPKNYATASKSSYVNGVRFRLTRVVGDYILAAEDDMKEMQQMASTIPDTPPAPGESLDYRNSIDLNKNMQSVIQNLIESLKELQKRVTAGGKIQP